MAEEQGSRFIEVQAAKVRSAALVFFENQILVECPFCGKTLVRTDYTRISKLLEETEPPRGTQCPKCNGIVAYRLNEKAKEIIRNRLKEIDKQKK